VVRADPVGKDALVEASDEQSKLARRSWWQRADGSFEIFSFECRGSAAFGNAAVAGEEAPVLASSGELLPVAERLIDLARPAFEAADSCLSGT
jgi:hypothetical protein